MVRDVKISDDCMRLADYFDYEVMESEQRPETNWLNSNTC